MRFPPELFADVRPVRLAYQPPYNIQQYFSLRIYQTPAISQQYFSLRTNQHQPPVTSQTNRLVVDSVVVENNKVREGIERLICKELSIAKLKLAGLF
jgi:hypothetical protein